MTTVSFNAIPGNILVPLFYAEINSGGTPYEGQSRLLLAGQKLSAGSAAAGVPVGPIQSAIEADALFGQGSMLASMYRIARRNAPFQPIWALPLADPAGNAATGTLTITAPGVTGAGILRVLGRRIVVQVNAADTREAVAAAIAAAINAAALPVSAAGGEAPNEHVVTVTARHVGVAAGNNLQIKVATNEPNALNMTNCVIVAMSGGTGTPSLDTPLANLGDDEYDWIAAPYADSTSLDSVKDFLNDTDGRWSPIKQLYGHYFTANFGTLAANVSLGNGRNDQHVSIFASQASPSPVWEWAAALGAQAAAHLTDAPELSRPLQNLPLLGLLPPDDRSLWWDIDDRQALYVDGMAGYRVGFDGTVITDRVVTTNQATVSGVPDATFRDVETMAQLVFATRFIKAGVVNRHGRQALADENPYNVAEICTPLSARNTLVHLYTELAKQGVVENVDLFARYLVVDRDQNNSTRLNAYLPLDVVNQLRVFAANITAFQQFEGAIVPQAA